MCNLSQGVKEAGIAIGEARGEAKTLLLCIIKVSLWNKYHLLLLKQLEI